MNDLASAPPTMTDRDRALAVLRYQPYDRLPLVHFGFLTETRRIWADQGHISKEIAEAAWDASPAEDELAAKLGFDFTWQNVFPNVHSVRPHFEEKIVATFPDGSSHVSNALGVVRLDSPGAGSIHAEVDHLLKDRASWEEHYKWRLQWTPARVNDALVCVGDRYVKFGEGGRDHLRTGQRSRPLALHCGSLYGHIRDMLGVENACYLLADDEALFDEIVATVADLCYEATKYVLASGAQFDFAHFWEDICYKNGPLINPQVFAQKIGPHYKRITCLVNQHGLDIVSVDCDGCLDQLVATWLENGVNTMFPIEVGTWNGSLGPWRAKLGKSLRGVGGMNKRAFSRDRAAVDGEIERLRPLVDQGGYLPCPDHRIPEDCKFELIQYYTERMREVFW